MRLLRRDARRKVRNRAGRRVERAVPVRLRHGSQSARARRLHDESGYAGGHRGVSVVRQNAVPVAVSQPDHERMEGRLSGRRDARFAGGSRFARTFGREVAGRCGIPLYFAPERAVLLLRGLFGAEHQIGRALHGGDRVRHECARFARPPGQPRHGLVRPPPGRPKRLRVGFRGVPCRGGHERAVRVALRDGFWFLARVCAGFDEFRGQDPAVPLRPARPTDARGRGVVRQHQHPLRGERHGGIPGQRRVERRRYEQLVVAHAGRRDRRVHVPDGRLHAGRHGGARRLPELQRLDGRDRTVFQGHLRDERLQGRHVLQEALLRGAFHALAAHVGDRRRLAVRGLLCDQQRGQSGGDDPDWRVRQSHARRMGVRSGQVGREEIREPEFGRRAPDAG